jgi:hypothetical protein
VKSYEHSKAFDQMKGITESISGNLTSLQYLQTLDLFLWKALEPIHAECPSLFNNYLAKITAHQSLKASTKFTSDDRAKLSIHLFNVITAPDIKKAHEHAKAMHINRGLLFGFISLFLNKLRYYEKLHSPFAHMDPTVRNSKMYRIERDMGMRHGGILYSAVQQVRYWYDKAREFKEMIVQKYTRMALLQAQSTYKDFNHYVPLDDVVQIYLMVVSRAIDRCDARQGVLTTFIMNWFKSARSEVANMARGQADQSVESMTEAHGDAASDILGFSVPDTSGELEEHIAWVAKNTDLQGYIRATLGIPEHVTRAQKELLRSFALEI